MSILCEPFSKYTHYNIDSEMTVQQNIYFNGMPKGTKSNVKAADKTNDQNKAESKQITRSQRI